MTVVLITGALTGIGRAPALAFAREGDQIVVSGRHGVAGEELAQEPSFAPNRRLHPRQRQEKSERKSGLVCRPGGRGVGLLQNKNINQHLSL
jgi:NAD(P)-dependent dehydrogenase (short-subunit alcohol dehydrogenase family)